MLTEEQKIIRTVLHKYKGPSYNLNQNISKKEELFEKQLRECKKSNNLDFFSEEVIGSVKFKSLRITKELNIY